MWPILMLMILSWGISIERIIYLKKAGIDKEKLLSLLKSQIMAGNIQGAVKVCSGNPTPVTRIIQTGLTKFNRPDAEVQAAMDEQALKEIPKLEVRTGYLAMLGNVAYAQSTDETRYILNGVYFNFKDGKLALVATDGRPLARGNPSVAILRTFSKSWCLGGIRAGYLLASKEVAAVVRRVLLTAYADTDVAIAGHRMIAFIASSKIPGFSGPTGCVGSAPLLMANLPSAYRTRNRAKR